MPLCAFQAGRSNYALNPRFCTGEKSSVRIVSLVGHARRAPKVIYRAVELQITSLNSLWQEVLKPLHSKSPIRFQFLFPTSASGLCEFIRRSELWKSNRERKAISWCLFLLSCFRLANSDLLRGPLAICRLSKTANLPTADIWSLGR